MTTFQELSIGDMFGTKPANFVKVSDTEAIVVQSSIFSIGDFCSFENNTEVIPLYMKGNYPFLDEK